MLGFYSNNFKGGMNINTIFEDVKDNLIANGWNEDKAESFTYDLDQVVDRLEYIGGEVEITPYDDKVELTITGPKRLW